MDIRKSIKCIGLYTNQTRPRAVEIRKQLCEWISKRAIKFIDVVETVTEEQLKEIDLVVCLGGDGTILSLANKIKNHSIPVLGVNAGSLGFVAEVRAEELYEELELVLKGSFEVENRMMLTAKVSFQDGTHQTVQALNDVVINREGLTRYMYVEIKIKGEVVTRFPGDGVIISTPTGSTAYSLAAGGPIVHPLLQIIIITPICPHTAALRPLVIDGDQVISIRVTCDAEKEKALLSADGHVDIPIDNNTVIEVTRSAYHFLLVKSSKRTYFGALREKLGLPG